MTVEYRVVWKRKDCKAKSRVYKTMNGAVRFTLLFGDEPWKYYAPKKEADSRVCCSGRECACEGVTFRQQSDEQRAKMPPLEYMRIECRKVSNWRAVA